MTWKRNPGSQFSEGSRNLWLLMRERGWSQIDLAHALGKNGGVVNRWLYGERMPDRSSAVLIHKKLGIEPGLWSEEPKEPFTPPAMEVSR